MQEYPLPHQNKCKQGETVQAAAHHLAQILFPYSTAQPIIYVRVSEKEFTSASLCVCVFDRKRAENLHLWCATGAVSPAGNKAS